MGHWVARRNPVDSGSVPLGRFIRRRNGHDAGGGVPRAHVLLLRGVISQHSLYDIFNVI